MSKTTFTDKELKIAAGDVVAAFSATLPSPDEYEQPFEYSSEFLSRMDVLVKRSRKRDAWTRAAQRAASIIIAFLIGSGVWLAVDVDARAAFITWIREVYEDSFVYNYFAEEPMDELRSYEIGVLPDGYVKGRDERHDSLHIKEYRYEENVITLLYYQMMEGRSHIVFDYSEFECFWETVEVGDIVADLYISTTGMGANELIWIDEEKGIVFEISAFLNKEKLISLAESIYKEE